jgi:NodT family efflux transporter outer membrane factor (OMF) lipoprotein
VQVSVYGGVRRNGWVRRAAWPRVGALAAILSASTAIAACTVGPDYIREAAPVPLKFKELKGFKAADPRDQLDRGDWWAPYHDSRLATLLAQVEISNQTVAAQAAAYEEFRANIRTAEAQLFPTATAAYGVTRTRTGSRAGTTGGSAVGVNLGTRYTTQYSAPINGNWDLDVWGKVRRQIESDTAQAQANAADLANAKLSAQAQLAIAYFNLRTEDSLIDIHERTIAEFKHTLEIVQNQFKAGFSVTEADVATADANVQTTEGQLAADRALRAQFEHAIAVFMGRPPAELTIAPGKLPHAIPHIPVTIPSALLERRPDIAAAERVMQQQNALIGVAEAGYFPDITLSAAVQFVGTIPLPFSAAHAIESIGANGTQTLFNGGLTAAQIDVARAVYWNSVATYRQTVLTAFQQVEDELVAIHYFTQQIAFLQKAIDDERTAVRVFLNQFQAGTVAFTTVVVAELQLLTDEQSELTARQNLFVASVTLIEALGGGWDTNLLPTQVELAKDFSLLPQLESPPTLGPLPAAADPPAALPPGTH